MRTAPRSTGSSRQSSAWSKAAALCGGSCGARVRGAVSGEAAARVFRPCGPGVDCGRVVVPLDRAGRATGNIRLTAIRVRARSRRAPRPRDAVVALSGGPGESAIPFVSTSSARCTRRSRRATCSSSTSAGPACRRRSGARGSSAGCSAASRRRRRVRRRLGPAVASYNTEEAARDIEAVRVASGARKLTLYGISYGTKVAMVYAALYPDRVERLVLDSVVDPFGPDPFDLDLFSAVSRVMREACAGSRCRGVTERPRRRPPDARAAAGARAARGLRGRWRWPPPDAPDGPGSAARPAGGMGLRPGGTRDDPRGGPLRAERRSPAAAAPRAPGARQPARRSRSGCSTSGRSSRPAARIRASRGARPRRRRIAAGQM